MIRFQCTCGKSYELSEALAGKKVQCAGCKQVLRVPASSTSVAPSPALAASALASPHQADPFTSAPSPSAYARQPPPRIELPTNVPAAPSAYTTSPGTPQPSWQPQGNYQVGGVQIDFGNTKVKAFQRRMLWLLVISLAIVPVTVVGVVVFLQATAPRNHIPAPTKGTPFQPKASPATKAQPTTPQAKPQQTKPTSSSHPSSSPGKGESKPYTSSKVSSP